MGVAAKRHAKRKAAKARANASEEPQVKASAGVVAYDDEDEDVEIEYVAAPLELEIATAKAAEGRDGDEDDGVYDSFKDIFEAFKNKGRTYDEGETSDGDGAAAGDGSAAGANAAEDNARGGGDANRGDVENDGEEVELSNKKKKELRRMKVAELKQHCAKPEVVEVWDSSASDPKLLVFLKAHRNTVPVPRHWSQKRAFLQGKRGIEKPPWELPEFIRATGIQKIRDHYAEKEDSKSLKQKAKDTKTARMGRMDIDYQILHDAFFVYQTKPKMSKTGDLYFEGKEYEVHVGRKPGKLSEELKAALGMTDGGPPPWLINMQRYGPPPSYPHLRVPGLSAPIPSGAQFGYHPGGWGKPPVDENGVPIYGDVFGSSKSKASDNMTPYDVPVDKTKRFGEIDDDYEEEEESEEEEEAVDEEGAEDDAVDEEEEQDGIESTLPAGTETPDVLDLRKKSDGPKTLYTVLPTQEASVGADQIVGSSHTYVVPSEADGKKRKSRAGGVEVTLDADALEDGALDDEGAIRAAYEQTVAAKKAAQAPEDFSDMVAEHARAQKRKASDKKKDSDAKRFKF